MIKANQWVRIQAEQVPSVASSLFVRIAVLFSPEELVALLTAFDDIELFNASSVVGNELGYITKEQFLAMYTEYVDAILDQKPFMHPDLFAVATCDHTSLAAVKVGSHRYLLRQLKPVIQLRPYHFSFSPEGNIQPMSFTSDKHFWGLEFSYPQLFAFGANAPAVRVWRSADHPNGHRFCELIKWIRRQSKVVHFFRQEKTLRAPFRVGKLPGFAEICYDRTGWKLN